MFAGWLIDMQRSLQAEILDFELHLGGCDQPLSADEAGSLSGRGDWHGSKPAALPPSSADNLRQSADSGQGRRRTMKRGSHVRMQRWAWTTVCGLAALGSALAMRSHSQQTLTHQESGMQWCGMQHPASAASPLPLPHGLLSFWRRWFSPPPPAGGRAATDGCPCAYPAVVDKAENEFVALDSRHPEQSCAYIIGAHRHLYGKLTTVVAKPSSDVWMSGYVFFPKSFRLPQSHISDGRPCSLGIHLWRLYEAQEGSRFSVDINVPAGTDHLQLFAFRVTHRVIEQEFVKHTRYRPAEARNRGRWQYWEFHIQTGTPGLHDGFFRFYSDGRLIDSMEHVEFLPPGDAPVQFRFADLQSNIGGPCGRLWPHQNGWAAEGVRVCGSLRCDKGPLPPVPSDLARAIANPQP